MLFAAGGLEKLFQASSCVLHVLHKLFEGLNIPSLLQSVLVQTLQGSEQGSVQTPEGSVQSLFRLCRTCKTLQKDRREHAKYIESNGSLIGGR